MKTEKQPNPNMHYLWWVNQKSQKRFCAGRAFYLEKSGDFSLYVNLLEASAIDGRRDEIYLRPVNVSDDSIYYKVDKVIYRDDKTLRFTIGEAYQNKQTNGDIHILIEPLTNFYKKLVINLTENREVKNA
ncbi:MAG: hypothetical protein ACOVP4_01440 [Bacteriovoracaceae bacterium]|jgi:hypothetical protein